VFELLVALQTYVCARRAEMEERGATAVEYALMVMFIAMAIFMSVVYLGRRTTTIFNGVTNTLPG
jgi:pilus assembly protein Flp/PilA